MAPVRRQVAPSPRWPGPSCPAPSRRRGSPAAAPARTGRRTTGSRAATRRRQVSSSACALTRSTMSAGRKPSAAPRRRRQADDLAEQAVVLGRAQLEVDPAHSSAAGRNRSVEACARSNRIPASPPAEATTGVGGPRGHLAPYGHPAPNAPGTGTAVEEGGEFGGGRCRLVAALAAGQEAAPPAARRTGPRDEPAEPLFERRGRAPGARQLGAGVHQPVQGDEQRGGVRVVLPLDVEVNGGDLLRGAGDLPGRRVRLPLVCRPTPGRRCSSYGVAFSTSSTVGVASASPASRAAAAPRVTSLSLDSGMPASSALACRSRITFRAVCTASSAASCSRRSACASPSSRPARSSSSRACLPRGAASSVATGSEQGVAGVHEGEPEQVRARATRRGGRRAGRPPPGRCPRSGRAGWPRPGRTRPVPSRNARSSACCAELGEVAGDHDVEAMRAPRSLVEAAHLAARASWPRADGPARRSRPRSPRRRTAGPCAAIM